MKKRNYNKCRQIGLETKVGNFTKEHGDLKGYLSRVMKCKDKEGNIVGNERKVMERLVQYFKGLK